MIKRALAISEKALGPEHPVVAIRLNNLARLYEAQGRVSDAEPLYKRALTLREEALGLDHPDTKASRSNLQKLRQSTDVPADVSREGQSGEK